MFKLRHIGAIEITSRCNLRCRYCPSPKMTRPKIDMDRQTLHAALLWVRKFSDANGHADLSFDGIGEPMLHPEFISYLEAARVAMGEHGVLRVVTNGAFVTDELAARMAACRAMVTVSVHRPEKAGPAVDILRRHWILEKVTGEHAISPHDWAGQVKWPTHADKTQRCPWVASGKVFVLADGRVSRCSMDASGVGVICHVADNLDEYQTAPYLLCQTCHMSLGFSHLFADDRTQNIGQLSLAGFRWRA